MTETQYAHTLLKKEDKIMDIAQESNLFSMRATHKALPEYGQAKCHFATLCRKQKKVNDIGANSDTLALNDIGSILFIYQLHPNG